MYFGFNMAMDILSYAAASQNAWSKNMLSDMGYETQTTFWQDFTIAECFGDDAIIDTFLRAFNEWKNNVVYLTELIMVLTIKYPSGIRKTMTRHAYMTAHGAGLTHTHVKT